MSEPTTREERVQAGGTFVGSFSFVRRLIADVERLERQLAEKEAELARLRELVGEGERIVRGVIEAMVPIHPAFGSIEAVWKEEAWRFLTECRRNSQALAAQQYVVPPQGIEGVTTRMVLDEDEQPAQQEEERA